MSMSQYRWQKFEAATALAERKAPDGLASSTTIPSLHCWFQFDFIIQNSLLISLTSTEVHLPLPSPRRLHSRYSMIPDPPEIPPSPLLYKTSVNLIRERPALLKVHRELARIRALVLDRRSVRVLTSSVREDAGSPKAQSPQDMR